MVDGPIAKAGAGAIPSTKDGQRQDFGEKNAQGDKGDKAGLGMGANNAKGDKGKAKKEKEAINVVKKKKAK